jgi:hypothetical protein
MDSKHRPSQCREPAAERFDERLGKALAERASAPAKTQQHWDPAQGRISRQVRETWVHLHHEGLERGAIMVSSTALEDCGI